MFKLQMDYNGRIRILMTQGVGDEAVILATGGWSDYRSTATLKHGGRTYIACSAYGGLPLAETVYDITVKATQLDDSMCHTDSATDVIHEPAL